MKVIHTISQFRMGGAQTLLLDISKELNDRGVKTEIVCFSDSNDLRDKTAHLPHFKIIPSSVELSTFRKNKFRLSAARQFFSSFKPNIIHSHLFKAELITRAINFKKAKYFSHCHDNMPPFQNLSLKTFFNKELLTQYYEKRCIIDWYRKLGGNNFIAISNDTYNYFKSSLPKDLENVNLLYNAIDYHRFLQEKETTNIQKEIRLVSIGSLVEKKNQIFLVEVVKYLKENGVAVKLDILGDGPNRNKIEKRIAAANLQQEITLHGNVNKVEQYLWNSDVYVHAATSEPFGLVLIEAMAAGLPVVTLDGKGNRDLIEEGRNGFMIFTDDVEKFSQKIQLLSNDQSVYQQMSKEAKKYARQYDIKEYVDRLLELYKRALV